MKRYKKPPTHRPKNSGRGQGVANSGNQTRRKFIDGQTQKARHLTAPSLYAYTEKGKAERAKATATTQAERAHRQTVGAYSTTATHTARIITPQPQPLSIGSESLFLSFIYFLSFYKEPI